MAPGTFQEAAMDATVARLAPWVLLVVLGGGCAAQLETAGGGTKLVQLDLVDAVMFDHGCPKDRIVFLRAQGMQVDLDVCGNVRRYKQFLAGANSTGGGQASTWLDVTALYPPESLSQRGQAP
jgi:hypothetical protein